MDRTETRVGLVEKLYVPTVIDIDGINLALGNIGEEIAVLKIRWIDRAGIDAVRSDDTLNLETGFRVRVSESAKRRRDFDGAGLDRVIKRDPFGIIRGPVIKRGCYENTIIPALVPRPTEIGARPAGVDFLPAEPTGGRGTAPPAPVLSSRT
jgi:hypothetical protein